MKPGYQRAISKELGRGAEVESPDGRQMALEVKSVTLVEDGLALFPDWLGSGGPFCSSAGGRSGNPVGTEHRCRVFADRV